MSILENEGGPLNTWVMSQTWKDLLFLHYPVSLKALQECVPNCFEIDTYNGQAWMSIVPFFTKKVRLHYLPRLPFSPSFPELNVRTYVTYKGKAGVYFFSLDITSRLVASMAKLTYHLPYYKAEMAYSVKDDQIQFKSKRVESGEDKCAFWVTYHPIGPPYLSHPESLEQWLTDRFYLFLTRKNQVYMGRIHHRPWPLQNAHATISVNTITDSLGIPLYDNHPELIGYCKELTCRVWPLKKVGIF